MNSCGLKINAFKTIVSLSNTLEVKLELRCGRLVLFVLVVMLPSLFSITVIVCTLPPGVIIALESASGIPGRFLSYHCCTFAYLLPISLCSAAQFGSAWVMSSL